MTKHPLVSVIIPFFAQEEFLRETVQSVLAQTYDNIEIIVCDDCSPGVPAEEILRDLQSPTLQIVRNKENGGLAAARNQAIVHARGELILPLDADDLIPPEFVSVTVAALLDGHYDAVYTDVQMFGLQTEIVHQDCSLLNLLTGTACACTFLFTRRLYDAVGGYKNEFRVVADHEFWINIISSGARVKHTAATLFHYRKHANGMSFNYRQTQPIAMRQIVNVHLDLYRQHLEQILAIKEDQYWRLHGDYGKLQEEWQQGADDYREIYSQWQSTHDNYLALEKEWEACHHNYVTLQKDVSEVTNLTGWIVRIKRKLANTKRKLTGTQV